VQSDLCLSSGPESPQRQPRVSLWPLDRNPLASYRVWYAISEWGLRHIIVGSGMCSLRFESNEGRSSNRSARQDSRYVDSPITSLSNITLEFIRRDLVVIFPKSIVNDRLLRFCFLSCPQLAVRKFSGIEGQPVYETRISRAVHDGG